MKQLARLPLFLGLLPLFFVFHGFVENLGFISVADCLPPLGLYLLSAGILFLVFFLLLRNGNKAALISFYLLSFYFFFGAVHDFLKAHAHALARYSILLSIFAAGALALFLYLRKRMVPGPLVLFLNCLFLIYLLVDTGTWITKAGRRPVAQTASPSLLSPYYKDSGNSQKPDIYLLIFDEYSANRTLQNVYHYDNSALDSFFKKEDFYRPLQSRSNYFFTTYSMASCLNLDYLNEFSGNPILTPDDNAIPLERLRTNEVVNFLMARGYKIVNNSPWDIPGHPGRLEQPFIPLKGRLITRRTLLNYISRDIGWWLESKIKDSVTLINDNISTIYRMNTGFLDSTLRESAKPSPAPRFVYMHVLMPHFYFLFDSLQHRRTLADIRNRPSTQWDPERYLEYLPYVNARIRELVTSIKEHSRGKAVILFLSDHGYRYYPTDAIQSYFFNNQNAVYLPDRDYSGFYDSITNVNEFRVVFDKLFHLNLPLLKDSVVVLRTTGVANGAN